MSSNLELLWKIKVDAADVKSTLAQVRSDLTQTADLQTSITRRELSSQQQLSAAASLQRQRSVALIADWKNQAKELEGLQASLGKAPFGNYVANLTSMQNALKLNSITSVKAADDFLKLLGPVGKIGTEAHVAAHEAGKFSEAFRALASTAVIAEGPLGGIAGRLRAVGAEGTELSSLFGPAGIVVAAALAATAAAVAAGIGLFELTKHAAAYGEEIFKAQQKTGLSAGTLSTLKVIAGETGTSLEALATAAARLQVNISKGVTIPTSEAGHALKLLGLQNEEFKKSTPDEQLQKTAVALMNVTSQADKNRAAQALLGRGWLESADAIRDIAINFENAQKKADAFGLTLGQDGVARAHEFQVALADAGMLVEGFGVKVGTWLVPQVTGALNDISSALTGNEGNWASWGSFIGEVMARVVNMQRTFALEVVASIRSLPGAIGAAYGTGSLGAGASVLFGSMDDAVKQGNLNWMRATVSGGAGDTKPKPSAPAFPSSGGGGKGKQGKDPATAELELEKEKLKGLEQVYKDEADSYARSLKAREMSLEEFVQKSEELELARHAATQPILIQELLTAEKIKDAGKRRVEVQKALNALAAEHYRSSKTIADDEEKQREQGLNLDRVYAEMRVAVADKAAEEQKATVTDLIKFKQISEEEGQKRLNKIELDAIDRHTAAAQKDLELAKKDAVKAAEIQMKLAILEQERANAVNAGNRLLADAREKDLENLRQYQAAYEKLLIDGLRVEEEIAKLGIQLLIASRASQLQIVNAEIADRAATETKRHTQELHQFAADRDAALKRVKGLADEEQKKLDILKQYDANVEKENRRHALAEAAQAKQAARDKALAGPGGGFLFGLQTGQLKALENGIQSFRDVATVAFSAVGAAINGVAQGVGQLVQSWVLMGETGPNAFRKLAATILASIAQQAATLAIMSLAYAALATTAVGAILLGGTPAQFLWAAALFGAVAVGTGLAGRAIAGDSFKPTSAVGTSGSLGSASSAGSSGTSASRSNSQSTQPQVINMGRNIVVEHVHVIQPPPGWTASETVKAINLNHVQLTAAIKNVAGRG